MDIRLDEAETALWHEPGSRGEAFRRATRDRAAEQIRLHGHMVEILDADGIMVDAIGVATPPVVP